MKTIVICSLLFLLVGCAPQTFFVVLRDVPDNPSFVVIPANDYLYQVEFANRIESYLISSGVKVVTRPSTKEVQATKQAAQVEGQSSQAAGSQATLTEKYMAFEDTNADYIVQTYADSKQIKVIRKTTKEILTTFELKKSENQKEDHIFRTALHNLGINVR